MNDRQLDDLLHKTVSLAVCEECCHLEQQALADKKHRFSRKFKKKMKALLKARKHSLPQESSHISVRHLRPRYLLLILLLVLLSSSAVLASEPMRQKLHSISYLIHDAYIDFQLGNMGLPSDEITFHRPTYIPAGFELVEETISDRFIDLTWLDSNDVVLSYSQDIIGSSTIHLSTDGGEPEDIRIGEIDGKLVHQSDGFNSIFYESEQCLFILSSFLPPEELVQILLSLE